MKRTVAPFGKGGVRLRLIEKSDLEITLSWRNREEARVWFKTNTTLSIKQHMDWYTRYLKRDDDFLFIIEVNSKPVGQASVYRVDWEAGTAEIGRFLVAPDETGRGFINAACAELIEFCEKKLALNYLFLEVFENNKRALRIYENHGFVEEGRGNGLIKMNRSLQQPNKRDSNG